MVFKREGPEYDGRRFEVRSIDRKLFNVLVCVSLQRTDWRVGDARAVYDGGR
jgi:hypothetical protein